MKERGKIMQESFENYRKVYQMLEDEESRDTYLNRLAYLISGDYKYIKNILTSYLPDIPALDNILDKLPQDQEIVLYGAGKKGSEVLQLFAHDRRFIGFCSNNPGKQKSGYMGYPVMSPEELLSRKDITVVVSAPSAKKEIFQLLHEGGYPENFIFDLYADAIAADTRQYFNLDFMTYEKEEVFIDAGCYNLEDTIKMRAHCEQLKRAYAFEPDPVNYKECLEKKEQNGLSEVEIFPFGTWSRRETLTFSVNGNATSKACVDGETLISVVAIDEMIRKEDRVTFIKMDVEGAELESLKGAVKTICRDHPKLAICIYHKTEDMVEIPMFIKKLVPEYRLYVRMHLNDGDETVLYAIYPQS